VLLTNEITAGRRKKLLNDACVDDGTTVLAMLANDVGLVGDGSGDVVETEDVDTEA